MSTLNNVIKRLAGILLGATIIIAGVVISTDQVHAWMQTTSTPAPSYDW